MDILLFGILVGILVLTIVVTVHEFGHFIVAKRNGVTVKEFGIGFPPKAITWLHVPRKEVEKYCKKFKYDNIKTEKILNKVHNHPKKKWFWIPLPKDEWYEETDEGLTPKDQDYLIFSLNWLPIGGFCQMDGETNIDTRKGTFGAASLWAKTKILFAGVTMNWLLAIIIFTVLAWTGMPKMFDNQYRVASDTYYSSVSELFVSEVFSDTPAETAGLKKGDKILEAKNGDEAIKIHTSSDLQSFNTRHQGETVTYKIHRESEEEIQCIKAPCDPIKISADFNINASLNDENAEYILGISMEQKGTTRYRSTWSGPIVAIVNTVQLTGETFRGLGQLVVNVFSGITNQFSSDENVKEAGKAKLEAAGDSVSGPVGIIGVLFPAIAQTGLSNVLFLTALISISLACMNVLPIPALDGGRWLLIALFRALKRQLTPEIESKIVSRAFMVLLILAGFITILDVMKILR